MNTLFAVLILVALCSFVLVVGTIGYFMHGADNPSSIFSALISIIGSVVTFAIYFHINVFLSMLLGVILNVFLLVIIFIIVEWVYDKFNKK